MSQTIEIVILAAGCSRRFGKPKQLYLYNGKSLLRNSIDAALDASIGGVTVVLGAHYERINRTIEQLPVTVIKNTEWQDGMSSSIRVAVQHLLVAKPMLEDKSVLLMVCDQPAISAPYLQELAASHQRGNHQLTASHYGSIVGVPVLFAAKFAGELSQLSGDQGAKLLLKRHAHRVNIVPFPDGQIDVDFPEDVQRLV